MVVDPNLAEFCSKSSPKSWKTLGKPMENLGKIIPCRKKTMAFPPVLLPGGWESTW